MKKNPLRITWYRHAWRLSLLVALLGTVTASCLPGRNDDDILCTEEFRMLTVTVRDSAGAPVVLSKTWIIRPGPGDTIDFAAEDPWFDSINRPQGIYLLMTDAKMSYTSLQGTPFEFHGYLGDNLVVRESYRVGNDRCHVILVAGKPVIVLGRPGDR